MTNIYHNNNNNNKMAWHDDIRKMSANQNSEIAYCCKNQTYGKRREGDVKNATTQKWPESKKSCCHQDCRYWSVIIMLSPNLKAETLLFAKPKSEIDKLLRGESSNRLNNK